MEAEEIKQRFQQYVDSYIKVEFSRGAVIGVMNYYCKNDSNRHLVLKFLTGKTSSKQLTDAEWFALFKFVQPTKPPGGKWTSAHGYELERVCGIILTAIADQPRQMKMELS